MPITVQELYKKNQKLYEMKLIAGEEGLDNQVQWVHIIEEEQVARDLHGYELVFSTGIRRKSEEWLLEFVKILKRVRASGLVLSIGPYIKIVPNEVLQYCEAEAVPLFTLPWKVKLVDVTRVICAKIMKNEEKEVFLQRAFQEFIFNKSVEDKYFQIVQKNGFDVMADYTVMLLSVCSVEEKCKFNNFEIVKFHVEKIMQRKCERFCVYRQEQKLVIVISDMKLEVIEKLAKLLKNIEDKERYEIFVAVGYQREGIESLAFNYTVTNQLLELSIKEKTAQILTYKKSGFFKLLLGNENEIGIQEFYMDYIGKIEKYDESNNTQYMMFLSTFAKLDFNIKKMAEKEHMHRNTVHYQINKINIVLGHDISEWETKVGIVMGLHIRKFL